MFRDDFDIPLKTSIDVFNIKKSCIIAEKTLRFLKKFIIPGITTIELDALAEKFIKSKGAISSLKGYKGFPGTICTSVNNIAAHGIPSDYLLKNSDIITIDISILFEGWHGDAAWSYLVGECTLEAKNLLKAAWNANLAGIMTVSAGKRMGDVGYKINSVVKSYGYSVIEDYVGHGIGQKMHEEPCIPNIGVQGSGMRIVPGMVFTIEPMVNLGGPQVEIAKDGWTVKTKDNSLSAQFEHTIAVFKDSIQILTFSKENLDEYLDYPPFL